MADDRQFQAVVDVAAVEYKTTSEDICGRSRVAGVVRGRQAVMYFLREKLGWQLPRIGAALGRDHSTVYHGCERMAVLLRVSAEERAAFARLESACGGLITERVTVVTPHISIIESIIDGLEASMQVAQRGVMDAQQTLNVLLGERQRIQDSLNNARATRETLLRTQAARFYPSTRLGSLQAIEAAS